MPDSEWRRFGLSESEAGALLQAADKVADSFDTDPDTRCDLSQDALYHALKLLKRQREGNPPGTMPDSGIARLSYLAKTMRHQALKFLERTAFDTPLDHSGRPHPDIQIVAFHD